MDRILRDNARIRRRCEKANRYGDSCPSNKPSSCPVRVFTVEWECPRIGDKVQKPKGTPRRKDSKAAWFHRNGTSEVRSPLEWVGTIPTGSWFSPSVFQLPNAQTFNDIEDIELRPCLRREASVTGTGTIEGVWPTIRANRHGKCWLGVGYK